jgi:spoIIIJ-associated protein
MTTEKVAIESRASGVPEAIRKGLAELGLSQAEVNIEVLDEGSSGFLGIGGRDAVVRLTPRPLVTQGSVPGALDVEVATEAQPPAAPTRGVAVEAGREGPAADEADDEARVARDIVDGLLQRLQMRATTRVSFTEPDDLTGERRTVIEIRGDDLGPLIGVRGETLNSLQYLSRLMVGHALHRRTTFILDVEGYRQRREQALRRLAQRMAEKAIRQGRPLTLEPMPAHERRIVHLSLRDNKQVHTESTGEGDRRRVRVFPADD